MGIHYYRLLTLLLFFSYSDDKDQEWFAATICFILDLDVIMSARAYHFCPGFSNPRQTGPCKGRTGVTKKKNGSK